MKYIKIITSSLLLSFTCSHVRDILQLSQLYSLFSHPAAGSENEDGTNIYALNMTNNCSSLKLLPRGQ